MELITVIMFGLFLSWNTILSLVLYHVLKCLQEAQLDIADMDKTISTMNSDYTYVSEYDERKQAMLAEAYE